MFAVTPALIRELTALVTASPRLAAQTEVWLRELIRPMAERGLLTAEPEEVISGLRQGLIDRAQELGTSLLGGIFGILTGALGTFLQAFGTLFIAIYLLIDIRRFETAYLRAVPAHYRHDALWLWEQLGRSLSRYLGGLLISLTVQGVMAFIAVSLLGVPYALLLGLWMSISAVLPYVGAWLGAIPAVFLALFISPLTAALTALAYLVINQLEGNFLTPRIQGESIRVHPLLIFVAVIAGGEIAGLAGAAFAVPVLAVIRVLAEFFATRLVVRKPVEPVHPVALVASTQPVSETAQPVAPGNGNDIPDA